MQYSSVRKFVNQWVSFFATASIAGLSLVLPASAQESDAETKALDSTATQWSFQFACQTMPDYFNECPGQRSTEACRRSLMQTKATFRL